MDEQLKRIADERKSKTKLRKLKTIFAELEI
jgi:hypothetical protein